MVGGLLITHLSGRGLVALDRANGEIVWETPLGITHYFSSPVMADGLIISGVEFGQLAALDPETGEVVWQGDVLDAQYPTQVLVEGDQNVRGDQPRTDTLSSGSLRERRFGAFRPVTTSST